MRGASSATLGPMALLPRQRDEHGFTLVEILVAVVVIGILLAIAAYSFLGQREKAEDSNATQYLALAYKAVQAESVDTGGKFAGVNGTLQGAERLAQLIVQSGVITRPEDVNVDLEGFHVLAGERDEESGGSRTVSGGPKQIVVDAASTGSKLLLYSTVEHLPGEGQDAGRIRECTLLADGFNAAPKITCVVTVP